MKISRISHCSFLIETNELTIITDPFFVDQPEKIITPTHLYEINEDSIKDYPFDAVLISHEHMDHFSERTLELFSREVPIYLPAGDRKLKKEIIRLGWHNINELEVFKDVTLKDLIITPTPSEAPNIEVGFIFKSKNHVFWHTVDSVMTEKSLPIIKRYIPDKFIGAFTYKFKREIKQREIIDEKTCSSIDLDYFNQSLERVRYFSQNEWICLDQGWISDINPSYTEYFQPYSPTEVINILSEEGKKPLYLAPGETLDLSKDKERTKLDLPFIKLIQKKEYLNKKEAVLSWDFDNQTPLMEKKKFISEVFFKKNLSRLQTHTNKRWFKAFSEAGLNIVIDFFVDSNESLTFSFDFKTKKWSGHEAGPNSFTYLHYTTCYGILKKLNEGSFHFGDLSAAGLLQLKRNYELEKKLSLRYFDITKIIFKRDE